MTPFVDDVDFTLYCGDALEVLRELPDERVHCALTSPPFYALRDYGTGRWEGGDAECDHAPVHGKQGKTGQRASRTFTGEKPQGQTCSRCGARRVDQQIGLEASPEEWASRLVDVFREVRRVLRPDGTLWVECGDSYAANRSYQVSQSKHQSHDYGDSNASVVPDGMKAKDLMGTPWLLAFALRADGWYLRQAIIWHKPNAMPESATDRCTTAHSYVFLLSKSPRYWSDFDAIGEAFSPNTNSRGKGTGPKQAATEQGGTLGAGRVNGSFGAALRDLPHMRRGPQAETIDGLYECLSCGALKTKTPESAAEGCGACGGELARHEGEAPRGPDGRRATHVRQGEHSLQHRDGDRWPNDQRHPRSVWTIPTQGYPEAHFATWPEALCERIIKAGCPEGGTCLDPFMGSGTTALVARNLGRKSIGIELNPAYAELAARRLQQQSLFAGEAA